MNTTTDHPALTPEIRTRVIQQDAWARLHRDAITDYLHRVTEPRDASLRIREEFTYEQAILTMMDGIAQYEAALDSPDYVLGEALGLMLQGFRALLNGSLGRLDGGTLDGWACDTLQNAGINPDTYEMP